VTTNRAKSRTSRFNPLSLITELRPGETGSALLLALDLFLLLTGYYILKTVREPLILMGGGAEVKSYASAGQVVLLFGAIPLYCSLVRRTGRIKLINRIMLFYAGNLALFYLLARMHTPYLGVVFYLWVGIFSLTTIAQTWSFANDLYTPEQGKRIFPLIAVGSSLGAIAGSWIAGRLFSLGIGPYEMMLVAAGLLLVCAGLIRAVVVRERRLAHQRMLQIADLEEKSARLAVSGLRLVFRDRYLLLIALMLLVANLVNTNGEYILASKVQEVAIRTVGPGHSAEQIIGGFYAGFFTLVNILSALMQLLLVSRILKYLGVRVALFFLPVIALGGYSLMGFTSSLAIIRLIKSLENSTDYSLQNTTRQTLFLPTSRDAKYQGKLAVDTFFVRSGDVLSAVVVFIGVHIGFAIREFALVNVALVLVWLLLAIGIGRRYRSLTEASPA